MEATAWLCSPAPSCAAVAPTCRCPRQAEASQRIFRREAATCRCVSARELQAVPTSAGQPRVGERGARAPTREVRCERMVEGRDGQGWEGRPGARVAVGRALLFMCCRRPCPSTATVAFASSAKSGGRSFKCEHRGAVLDRGTGARLWLLSRSRCPLTAQVSWPVRRPGDSARDWPPRGQSLPAATPALRRVTRLPSGLSTDLHASTWLGTSPAAGPMALAPLLACALPAAAPLRGARRKANRQVVRGRWRPRLADDRRSSGRSTLCGG